MMANKSTAGTHTMPAQKTTRTAPARAAFVTRHSEEALTPEKRGQHMAETAGELTG